LSGRAKYPGLVAILSSPSGTGKTSICRGLLKTHKDFRFSVSATTRPARRNERNGVDYRFVSERRFDSMVRKREFAEWEEVFGYRYGTAYSEIERAISRCHVLLCDIDVKGGMNLKKNYKEAVTIFILPPSEKELKRRLYKRRTDSPEQMDVRLKKAVWEIGYWRKYDYLVINDNLKEATAEVDKIIAAERTKTTRLNEGRFWRSPQARLLGL
jgi:guanylate kinase